MPPPNTRRHVGRCCDFQHVLVSGVVLAVLRVLYTVRRFRVCFDTEWVLVERIFKSGRTDRLKVAHRKWIVTFAVLLIVPLYYTNNSSTRSQPGPGSRPGTQRRYPLPPSSACSSSVSWRNFGFSRTVQRTNKACRALYTYYTMYYYVVGVIYRVHMKYTFKHTY